MLMAADIVTPETQEDLPHRAGHDIEFRHDVKCRLCGKVLFKTRSIEAKLRENFAHVLEIQCTRCKAKNLF